MACTTLTGIQKSCANNIGGIKSIWMWDMTDDVDTTAITFDTATWKWTAYDITAGSLTAPISFDFIRNSSNYTEESNIDLANGSSYVTVTINLIFTRREAAKSKTIKILGEGQRYLGALVLDQNGKYWLFQDLQLSATGEGSGTAKADGSKYSVTLLGEVENLAGEVDAADAATFISTGVFV